MALNEQYSPKHFRDQALIERAKQGDERAFYELYDQYRNALYFLILKMVRNACDAEDLTMEAFMKAFSGIATYEPRYAFSAWLFRIARNTTIDFIRHKKNSIVDFEGDRLEGSEDWFSDSIAPQPSPVELLVQTQGMERVEEIVATMHPRYQKLVKLRYFEEYTYDEIALALNMPMGTVKAQLFRLREQLNILFTDSTQFL